MESNEQIELTSKTKTDFKDGEQMTAKARGLVSGGMEQKGKRTHGHGQQCGDCGRGKGGGIRGISDNG